MSLNLILAIAAGLCAFALGVAAVCRKRHSLAAWFFLAGMGIFAAESAFACLGLEAINREDSVFWIRCALIAGSFLPGVWLCFSLTYSRGNYRAFLSQWRWPIVAAYVLPIGIAVGFRGELVHLPQPAALGGEGAIRLGVAAKALHIAILLATVFILGNLEKTFRTAVGTTRWRVKFFLLGLGVVFGVRIYTLSQALLFSGYIPALATVESGALLIACALVAVAYLRGGFAEFDLYPSTDILHRSVTFLVTGGYLFAVGVLAKVVSYLGGSQSFPAQAFVVLLGVAGLAVLLMSDRARITLQAFISRHLKRPRHDFRKVWTLFSKRVSSVPDRAAFGVEAARLMSETFDALSVTIFLLHDDEKTMVVGASTKLDSDSDKEKAAARLEIATIEAGLKGVGRPILLEDIQAEWAESLRAASPSQFECGGQRVCVPLRSGERLLGLVILADRVRGMPYTHEELDLLGCVGDQVAAGFLNLRLTEEILRAKELEAFQTMSSFFVHDMKNAASSLNLMLQNLPAHMDDPAFRVDALRAISKAVGRINHLTGRLNSFRQKLGVDPVESDLNELVEEALKDLGPDTGFELAKEFHPVAKIPMDREQIRNVVTNLVLNARAALGAGGRVCVETSQQNGYVVLAVEDNGCGMSPEFLRDSLFRPFQTTKKDGLGIGMFQSKMIVEAHHGKIQVESEPKKGTTIRVSLPAADS